MSEASELYTYELNRLRAELAAEKANNRKVDVDIDAIVTRFLSWKLPEHFHPDAGISFTPKYNIGTPYERKHEPIGTNLLTADQAKEMFTYCLQYDLNAAWEIK